MADKDAERFETQYFVDVEGTIPAKPGDAIALVVSPTGERMLNAAGRSPIYTPSADDLADRL